MPSNCQLVTIQEDNPIFFSDNKYKDKFLEVFKHFLKCPPEFLLEGAQSDGAGVRRVNRRQSLTVDVVILVEQHHRRLLLANDFPECPRSQLVDAGPVDGTRNNQYLSDCRGPRSVVALTQGCCRRH